MADPDSVRRTLEGCQAAIHAAAHVSVTDARQASVLQKNTDGARNVLGAAVDAGLGPVVLVSSLTAIFDPRGGDTTADSSLVYGQSAYGQSKAASDALARELQERGAPVAIVYPGGVVGPEDTGLSESVRAQRGFLRGGTLRVGGTSMVDVRDLAELLLQLIERGNTGRFVAAGRYVSWDELTAMLEEVTGAKVPRVSVPGWLLRGAGRVFDLLGRATGRTFPITHEAAEIATRWRPIADSPEVAEMGVAWRPARETIVDMFRWLVESGHLRAEKAPKLARGAGA